MSAAGIRAGRAFVEIGTDQTLFDRGIKAVRASMQRLSASAATIGRTLSSGFGAANGALKTMAGGLLNTRTLLATALGGAGLTMFIKQFADAAGNIDDMAQRTGATTEELSALGYAAKMSGSDMGAVEKALRKLQQSGKVLSGMTATQSLIAYADQIAAIQDPAKRAETAIKLFGKSGAMLLPMLANGSQGLQDMADQAADLGLVMSTEDAVAGAELGDAMDNLMMSLGGITNRIGATLSPMLIDLANRLTDVVITVSDFINDNRDLVVTLAQWAAVGAGVLAGVAALGGAGLVLSGVMTGLAAISGALVTVLGGIAAAVTFLLSPIGLVIGGVVAAAGAFVYFSGTGSAAIQYLSDQFGALIDWVMPILDAITTALMSGQWADAASIAMLALEMAVRTGVQPIYNIWTDVYSFLATTTTTMMATVANLFASGWTAVVTGFATGWTTIINGFATGATWLTNIFASIPGSLMQGFNTAITWLTGAWDSTVSYIAKKLLYLYSLFDKSVDYEMEAKQMDDAAAKRAADRQRDLDAANNQLQADTDRANTERLAALEAANAKRNKALSDANAKRTQDLQDANQARADFAAGINQGIQDQANERKEAFDNRITEIGNEIAGLVDQVKTEAERRKTERAERPERPKLDLAPMTQTAMATSDKAVGAFSGFAVSVLGGGGKVNSMQSLVKLQTSANETLTDIAENTADLDGDGVEFGA